jgi:hypothetical protein
VLVCQLLDVSYGLQLYQAVGGVVLHLVLEGIDQSMPPRLKYIYITETLFKVALNTITF